MKDLGNAIRSGAAWSFVGKFSTEILNFAVGIVLARLLMPEHFGLIATVGILTSISGYFAGAGIGQALVRAVHVDQRHFDVMFTLQIALSTVIYVFLLLISKPFADFFGNPIYEPLLLVSGITFFLRPFANLPSSRLAREMRFKALTIVGVVTIITSSSVSITLAYLSFGPWSLIAGGLVGAALRAYLLGVLVKQRYRFGWDAEIARDMGAYGAKIASNNLIEHFRGQSLTFMLSKLNGPADVGLFNRALSLSSMPMRIIGSAPYQAVFRALASEQQDLNKSRYIYYRTITLVATYTLPLYLLVWWLAEPGVLFIYGEKWLPSAEPLSILAITGVFSCVGNPSGAVIEARNRVSLEIGLNLSSWLLLIPGVLYGLQWGLPGAAWATTATLILFNAGVAMVASRELNGSMSALTQALRVPLLLNGLLLATILASDAMLPRSYAEDNPGLYAAFVSVAGMAVYASAFLYLPIDALRAESARWRTLLRLGGQ